MIEPKKNGIFLEFCQMLLFFIIFVYSSLNPNDSEAMYYSDMIKDSFENTFELGPIKIVHDKVCNVTISQPKTDELCPTCIQYQKPYFRIQGKIFATFEECRKFMFEVFFVFSPTPNGPYKTIFGYEIHTAGMISPLIAQAMVNSINHAFFFKQRNKALIIEDYMHDYVTCNVYWKNSTTKKFEEVKEIHSPDADFQVTFIEGYTLLMDNNDELLSFCGPERWGGILETASGKLYGLHEFKVLHKFQFWEFIKANLTDYVVVNHETLWNNALSLVSVSVILFLTISFHFLFISQADQ